MAPSFPKKLTTKACGFDAVSLNALVEKNGKKGTLPILRIVGNINDIEVGTSTFGEWTKFVGEHYAVNLADGSEYKSRKLMLPEVGADLLNSELKLVKSEDKNNSLNYALEVGVKYRKPVTEKDNCYEFTITSLIESKQKDPLKTLMDSLPKPKALPAK